LLRWLIAAIAACAIAILTPSSARADAAPDSWQWAGTLYVWLPSLSGETSFPPGGGGPSIDVTADAILDALKMVFMGAFEGRKAPWGLATDVIYLDLEASKKATRQFGIGRVDIPASVNADLTLGISGWLWTLDGTYTFVQRDNFSTAVLAGVRMLDLQQDLHYTFNGDISSLPLPGRTGSASARQTQWDAIVGLKGRASFGADQQWYVPYYVDVGAGDSALTWQVMAGVGYSFGSIDVLGVWRYLDYDLGNGTPIQSISFNGPAIGVTFRF
jgi:opacity protein-like surface antigen